MSTYQCSFCGKKYNRESFYLRHELSCDLKNITQNTNKKNKRNDIISNFTHDELNSVVKELLIKVSLLETELEFIKKWTNKQKKKCNIFEWLNQSFQPTHTLNEWVDNFNIKQQDLSLVLKDNYIEGISNILQQLFPVDEEKIFPIRTFEQRPKEFYVYQNNAWKLMPYKDFKKFVLKIQHKLILLFQKWRDENLEIVNDNKRNEAYLVNVIKVMGGNFDENTTFNRIRNNLYNYLKYDLKQIIEYEFVF
tara:strand:- start:71 stop:820 length:750 start_codon:yes stop_codon:yes gene_type:complete